VLLLASTGICLAGDSLSARSFRFHQTYFARRFPSGERFTGGKPLTLARCARSSLQ